MPDRIFSMPSILSVRMPSLSAAGVQFSDARVLLDLLLD
jgi:hypothetical protein